MRGRSILILLVLILPTLQPGPSITVDGTAPTMATGSWETSADLGLMITEVCPGRPVEYLILSNYGSDVQLDGAIISDGEGNVTILSNKTLAAGQSIGITVDAEIFRYLHPDIECLVKGSPELSWRGRFVLADSGDRVILVIGGQAVDVVSYGSDQYAGDGWSGPPVGPVPTAHALVREGGDHNTSDDWTAEPPGRSDLSTMTFEAVVEPFSAPEDALARLIRELDLASRTVHCAVYELADPEVVNALARCSRRGVDVKVLLEGQPVGGVSNASMAAISTLQASAVDVRLLRSFDSYKRYDYLHSKYMVADVRRVVVMSENWGVGLTQNRGWGVCMDGAGIGWYFDQMFEQDFYGQMDITVPSFVIPVLEPKDPLSTNLDDLARFRCKVTPVISPDLSEGVLHGVISQAEHRLLIEQLSVAKDWLSGPSLVSDLIAAASRGVQVRVLLDSSWGARENREVVEALNDLAIRNRLDLEARLITDFHNLSVMHNKGVIADDQVIVSSINWGDNALVENREAGVLISSPEVTSFFADLFWTDWSVDPIPPTATLPWYYISIPEGETIFLDGTLSRDNSRTLGYEWDISGDGTVENSSSAWAIRLGPGNHTIVLTVRDPGYNTASAICWVEVLPRNATDYGLPSLILIVPILTGVSVLMLKRIIGRKRY